MVMVHQIAQASFYVSEYNFFMDPCRYRVLACGRWRYPSLKFFAKLQTKFVKYPPHLLNNVKVLYVLDFVAFKDFHVQHTGSSRGLTPPAIGGRIRRIGKKNEGKGFLNVANPFPTGIS